MFWEAVSACALPCDAFVTTQKMLPFLVSGAGHPCPFQVSFPTRPGSRPRTRGSDRGWNDFCGNYLLASWSYIGKHRFHRLNSAQRHAPPQNSLVPLTHQFTFRSAPSRGRVRPKSNIRHQTSYMASSPSRAANKPGKQASSEKEEAPRPPPRERGARFSRDASASYGAS